jgi:hypothetical protein
MRGGGREGGSEQGSELAIAAVIPLRCYSVTMFEAMHDRPSQD